MHLSEMNRLHSVYTKLLSGTSSKPEGTSLNNIQLAPPPGQVQNLGKLQ